MDSIPDTERCGIIVYNGGPGDINHEKGVHRTKTQCPCGRWKSTDADERLAACRSCRYYLAPGQQMPSKF